MIREIFFSYALGLGFSLLNFGRLVRKQRMRKKLLGSIQAKWSGKFNLSFLMSWIRWGGVLVYFLWCVYQVKKNPFSLSGHLSFILLCFLLSFAPLSYVYVGSRGMMTGLKPVLWKNVINKEIVVMGKKKYLKAETDLQGSSSSRKLKIRLPRRVNRKFQGKSSLH